MDWPEDRRQDFCGLVELAQHLLETPDEQGLPHAIRALAPDWRAQCLESGEKAATPPADKQAQQTFCLLTERLSALPEPGPQPPCADPRLIPNWRLHVLRTLLARYQARSRQEADGAPPLSAPAADAGSSAGSILEPILRVLQQMVHAWRFPPEGYFRDPYNDASILWIAAGLFWPHLADALTENARGA